MVYHRNVMETDTPNHVDGNNFPNDHFYLKLNGFLKFMQLLSVQFFACKIQLSRESAAFAAETYRGVKIAGKNYCISVVLVVPETEIVHSTTLSQELP